MASPGFETRIRLEHWTNAVDQAVCVAHNLACPDDLVAYRPVPYVWTDQHGWKFQIVGQTAVADRHRLIGELDVDRPRAALLYADEGDRLTGALTINWPRALADCRRSIGAQADAESVRERLNGLAAAA